MAGKIRIKSIILLIPLFLIIAACSQTPETTLIPTSTPIPQPTIAPIQVTEKVTIVSTEAVVEKIMVQDVIEGTGDLEIVVQGFTSNACTVVDDATISRDGDVFSVILETSINPDKECKGDQVSFEKTLTLNTLDLDPGIYLVASGTVGSFELVEEQSPETNDESGESASAGNGSDVETVPQDESGSGDAANEDEQIDCQDNAIFLADVTIPDYAIIDAGEIVTKTWEIRNDGTCPWGSGYELIFNSGTFSGVKSLVDPFPEVEPDGSVELSAEFTAPDSAGTHTGIWLIKKPFGGNVEIQEGENFELWSIINVPEDESGLEADTQGEGDAGETVLLDGVVCAQANADYASQVLDFVNDARTSNSLQPYESNPQLTNAAQIHVNDVACNGFINEYDYHIGLDGSDWFERINAQGYEYEDAAENIYFGYGGVPDLAFSWWMDNSGYQSNILNPNMTQIGVGYALNPQTGASYYTLVFATPVE